MKEERKKKREAKYENEKIMNSNKGITLIALIITIIVLLILAGVSIATLTGDNGLLTKANSVKTRTEEAQIEEEIILAYNLMQMKEGTEQEKIKVMEEELKKRDPDVEINEEKIGKYKGYDFSIQNGKVTLEKASDEVIGTREDWEISDDGKLGLYKGAIPSNGTIVTPTLVDGIKIKEIDVYAVSGEPLSFIWRSDEGQNWRYL